MGLPLFIRREKLQFYKHTLPLKRYGREIQINPDFKYTILKIKLIAI